MAIGFESEEAVTLGAAGVYDASMEENEVIKVGKTPEGWEKQPAKNAQKDKDARWPKKNHESFYSYKNHVGVDKAYKLIRKRDATDAARARQSEAGRCARSLQHRQGGLGAQRLPLNQAANVVTEVHHPNLEPRPRALSADDCVRRAGGYGSASLLLQARLDLDRA